MVGTYITNMSRNWLFSLFPHNSMLPPYMLFTCSTNSWSLSRLLVHTPNQSIICFYLWLDLNSAWSPRSWLDMAFSIFQMNRLCSLGHDWVFSFLDHLSQLFKWVICPTRPFSRILSCDWLRHFQILLKFFSSSLNRFWLDIV